MVWARGADVPAPAACSHLWPLGAAVALWKLATLRLLNISLYLSNSSTQILSSVIHYGTWLITSARLWACLLTPAAISASLMWDPADAGWLWMFKKAGVSGNVVMKRRKSKIIHTTLSACCSALVSSWLSEHSVDYVARGSDFMQYTRTRESESNLKWLNDGVMEQKTELMWNVELFARPPSIQRVYLKHMGPHPAVPFALSSA